MLGRIHNGFSFQEEIGSGAFGTVYRAEEVALQRIVAVKVINPEHAYKSDFKEVFASEAKMIAKLEHPYIAKLYRYWQDDLGSFLVLSYKTGGSLQDLLDDKLRLSAHQISRILGNICNALDYAHRQNVVHRDIKPGNVLLDHHGFAYLTDFGIALQLESAQAASDEVILTGTLAYLAPENLTSNFRDPTGDIYALGVMLYEMLTGDNPLTSREVNLGRLRAPDQSPFPHIMDKRPDLPEEINDVLRRATATNPAQRYQSPVGLVNAFDQAISVPRKTPSTRVDRNRLAMLDNVEKLWIDGVLSKSVKEGTLINLSLKTIYDVVDSPHDSLLKQVDLFHGKPLVSSIVTAFDEWRGKILILGDPGSGKTTLLLYLAQVLIGRAKRDNAHPMPVIFNLSSWDNSAAFEPWLLSELHTKYHVPKAVAGTWMALSQLTLLLDGLDEVAAKHRNSCVAAISKFIEANGFVDVVVSSRKFEYDELSTKIKLNGAIEIQPLEDSQINSFVDAVQTGAHFDQGFESIRMSLSELIRTPLILNILVTVSADVFDSQVALARGMNEQRNRLLQLYVERLLLHHAHNTLYTNDQVEKYLAWFARKMQDHALSELYIENIQPSWLPDTLKPTYHKTIILLMVPMISIIWGPSSIAIAHVISVPILPFFVAFTLFTFANALLFATEAWRRNTLHLLPSIFHGLFVWMPFVAPEYGMIRGLLSSLAGASTFFVTIQTAEQLRRSDSNRDKIAAVEKLRFDPAHVNYVSGLMAFAYGMFNIFIPAFVFNRGDLPPEHVAGGAAVGGMIVALVALYESGLSSEYVRKRIRPNQGMKTSFSNANRFATLGLVQWVLAYLIGFTLAGFSWVAGLAFGITIGIAVGFAYWVSHGGMHVAYHIALRTTLRRYGNIPPDVARFLDYCVGLGLMRRVGGGYIFVHRYLQAYFANLPPKEIAAD